MLPPTFPSEKRPVCPKTGEKNQQVVWGLGLEGAPRPRSGSNLSCQRKGAVLTSLTHPQMRDGLLPGQNGGGRVLLTHTVVAEGASCSCQSPWGHSCTSFPRTLRATGPACPWVLAMTGGGGLASGSGPFTAGPFPVQLARMGMAASGD